MAFLTAGDIGLVNPLKNPLSDIEGKRRASLETSLGRIEGRNRQGQVVSGRPMGEYTGEELGRSSTMANRGVEDMLYGVLGKGSYKDLLSEQEHQRQMALAKKVGRAYAPSLGQEIMSGVTLAGQIIPAVAGAGKSAYNYFNQAGEVPLGSASNPYNLESALSGIRGYDPYPNMMRMR